MATQISGSDVSINGTKVKRLNYRSMTYRISDYIKTNTYYRIPLPTDHTYLIATLHDWSSGGLSTSPFTITFNGTDLLIIVGSVEPVNVTVILWYYD